MAKRSTREVKMRSAHTGLGLERAQPQRDSAGTHGVPTRTSAPGHLRQETRLRMAATIPHPRCGLGRATTYAASQRGARAWASFAGTDLAVVTDGRLALPKRQQRQQRRGARLACERTSVPMSTRTLEAPVPGRRRGARPVRDRASPRPLSSNGSRRPTALATAGRHRANEGR